MTAHTAKLKLLLIDDSELVLRHVSALLQSRGWSVETAKSMADGLEAHVRWKPDATLVDFVLGNGQTGLEVISAIFALSATLGTRNPPAAVLTHGQLSTEDAARAQYLGAPVLQKPTQGKEQDFLRNVEFWLHDAGLL